MITVRIWRKGFKIVPLIVLILEHCLFLIKLCCDSTASYYERFKLGFQCGSVGTVYFLLVILQYPLLPFISDYYTRLVSYCFGIVCIRYVLVLFTELYVVTGKGSPSSWCRYYHALDTKPFCFLFSVERQELPWVCWSSHWLRTGYWTNFMGWIVETLSMEKPILCCFTNSCCRYDYCLFSLSKM